MSICSVPRSPMPLLNYSYQRVNQIPKKEGKRNKVLAGQRTEWEPSQTQDVGMS